MTRFWLIRHGEPEQTARGRCYGSLDVGLSDRGREQIEHVASALAAEPITHVWASPRRRTLESAKILAARHACPCDAVNDLREINFGAFEGLPYDEIAQRYPELYAQWMTHPTEVQFPEGESYSQMRARVLAAFEKIRAESERQTTALVAHGGVIRAILAWALEMPDQAIFRLAQPYAALTALIIQDGLPILERLNTR